MEFTLLSSAGLAFTNKGPNRDGTMTFKMSEVKVDKLEGVGPTCSGSFTCANILSKLEHLLLAAPMAQGSQRGNKRLCLSQPMDCRLKVCLFYGAIPGGASSRTHTGICKIAGFDKSDQSNGLLQRLMRISGGHNNIQSRLEMQFGTNEEKMKLNLGFEDLPMKCLENEIIFASYFNFTESLGRKWDTEAKFTGTLSLYLKLNDEAVNLIHVGSLGANDLINRKLLKGAAESGDGIIVVENEKEIRCHKGILFAHSDVFKAMFNSDMKEGKSSRVIMSDMSEAGVKALLDYLYCCDIREALKSSLVAVELLKAADKYGIDKLFETMKDLILAKENTWFSVDAVVQLFTLVKNRADSAEFKEMEKKAKLLLKSKPVSELKECAEFRELFDNSDNAINMWSYFMENQ